MIDTGSDATILHWKVFSKLKNVTLKPAIGEITGFSGHKVLTKGMATLKFSIGEKQFEHDFHIIDGWNFDNCI